MALRSLYPVRLLDDHTSGGYQITMEKNDMDQLWAILPAFVRQMKDWQQEYYPTGSAAVELFAANVSDGVSSQVRKGIHIRFRLAENADAKAVDAFCRDDAERTVKWLIGHGIQCDVPETDEKGTACLYPKSGESYYRFFTKERRAEKNDEEILFSFSPLTARTAPTMRDLKQAVLNTEGCGLSLHLLPDLSSFEGQKNRAEKALSTHRQLKYSEEQDFTDSWGMVFTIWSPTEKSIKQFTNQITTILQKSGIFLSVKTPRTDGPKHVLQLIYDPWALFSRYMDQIGVRLSLQAVSVSEKERERLFKPIESQIITHATTETPGSYSEVEKSIRAVQDDQLNDLADRLEDILTTDQFLAATGEMMTRLDSLIGKENEIGEKLQKLDAIIAAQEAVYLKRMDMLEENVTSNIEQGNDRLLSQMNENLESILQKIAEIPVSEINAAEITEAIAGMMPPQTNLDLTKDELSAFGIQKAEELKNLGMTDEEIRLMRVALALARMGLEQADDIHQYMPFAAPLGCLYEMLVYNSFNGKMMEKDLESRRAEYEQRQTSDFQQERRMPPANKEETELSFFDYISFQRVHEVYYKHVALNHKKMKDAVEWNIWFACFKCVRAIRNKVHSNRGNVSREELENLYRMMVFQGPGYKKKAIQYQISNPSKSTKGNTDTSLLIRHYDGKKHPPTTLIQYINQHGSESFQLSLIRFLLDLRNTAEWQDEPAMA